MSFRELNIQAFRGINDLGKQFDWLNPVMALIAENTIYVLGIAVIFFLFSSKNRLMIITGLIALVFAELAGKLSGSVYSNNQPFAELSDVNKLINMEVNNSFPSDHTIIFFTLTASFWLFKRKHHYLWVLLALIVGFSRIWVGVHYPGDVTAGAIIGALMAYLAHRIIPNTNIMKKWYKSDYTQGTSGKNRENLNS
jgi:undecaprenyl-diphosphatase